MTNNSIANTITNTNMTNTITNTNMTKTITNTRTNYKSVSKYETRGLGKRDEVTLILRDYLQ